MGRVYMCVWVCVSEFAYFCHMPVFYNIVFIQKRTQKKTTISFNRNKKINRRKSRLLLEWFSFTIHRPAFRQRKFVFLTFS